MNRDEVMTFVKKSLKFLPDKKLYQVILSAESWKKIEYKQPNYIK